MYSSLVPEHVRGDLSVHTGGPSLSEPLYRGIIRTGVNERAPHPFDLIALRPPNGVELPK